MPDFQAIFPLLTLLLGSALTFFADNFREQRRHDREGEARREQRRVEAQAASDAYQREVLEELQVRIQELARAVGGSHHHDQLHWHEHSRRAPSVPEEFNRMQFEAGTRLVLLASRLRDRELAARVEAFKGFCSREGARRSDEPPGDFDLMPMADMLEELHELIGRKLREPMVPTMSDVRAG